MADRFKLGSEVYEFATPDDVTLRDLILVQQETEDLGWSVNLGEINRLVHEWRGLSRAEQQVHPDGAKMLVITIWVAMVHKLRQAGDYTTRVPISAALDAPLSEFTPLTSTEDHKPGKAKKPRRASGAAVAPRTTPPAG